tara:strand:- start:64 stop:528 length:465 start_codon:yes stop_codon:yes gene_type:complete
MELGPGLIGLALVLITGAWLFHRLVAARADVAAHWPTVTGTVTASRYEETADTTTDGDTHVRYFANVAYRYAVGDRTYSSERIAFHGIDTHSRLVDVQAIIDRYPVGAAVPVHYNPAVPGEAVLEVRRPGPVTPVLVTLFGLLMLVGGVWMVIG